MKKRERKHRNIVEPYIASAMYGQPYIAPKKGSNHTLIMLKPLMASAVYGF